MTATLGYAFALGFVAAINPCGFPLLPAYLAFFAERERAVVGARRTLNAITTGAAVTVGFVIVFCVTGTLADAGVRLAFGWIPWVMIVLATIMIAVAARAVGTGVSMLRLPMVPFRPGRSVLAMAGFGVAYAVASLSCALPLFLIAVAGAFIRSGLTDGVLTFLSYALGMGSFVLICSIITANTGATAGRRLGRLGRYLPRASAVIVGVVGLYLAYYWTVELIVPLNPPHLIQAVDAVQSAASNWLATFAVPLAAVLAAAIAIMVAASTRPHHRPKKSENVHLS